MENANLVKQIEPIKDSINQAVSEATLLVIKTNDDMPIATDLLGRIKSIGKKITETKETITKPLNEALKNARSFFSPVESEYEKAERIVKTKMLDFQRAETIRAAKKAESFVKKVEEGKMTFEKASEKMNAVAPKKVVESEHSTVQFRTVKEVVVVDEKLVPRDYLVLDMVKIRKVALAGVEIPGVKVEEKQTIAGSNKY